MPTFDQGVTSAGVTSCQLSPSSFVRQISPSSVPTHRSPSTVRDGAIV